MSLKDEFWEDHHKDCPWHTDGQDHNDTTERCLGQVSYNGHINDPRYDPCQQETCPIFFWITAVNEEV